MNGAKAVSVSTDVAGLALGAGAGFKSAGPRRAHAAGQGEAGIRFSTSSGSGNRPVSCFEKSVAPSRTTSKTPPEPFTSSASMPLALRISAARPAALGRYPH